jgi:hypothetical protein
MCWLLQLTDMVMENGSDYLGVPLDAKQDLLLGLHDATAIELPATCSVGWWLMAGAGLF